MKIVLTQQSTKWIQKHKISIDNLFHVIKTLCRREGRLPRQLRLHIMPRAIHSFFDLYTNTLHVAVQSSAQSPRYIKISRMSRNLLHELRHFIQYRIFMKPCTPTYTFRDAVLINSNYLNDPDEIDARKYEKSKLKFCYKRLIR